MKKFIADKKFYKYVLAIAIPLMLQNLITAVVNLVDNLMVGQLGDAALGGVGAVNRLYIIAFFAINGFVNASTVFVAQYHGAGDKKHVKHSFRVGLIISGVIAVLFIAIVMLFTQPLVSFFTDVDEIIVAGTDYLKVMIWMLVPMSISIPVANSMRALGRIKPSIIASLISIFTNMAFNYILIFGHFGFPEMGVQGAALATVIARTVEMSILLVALKIGDFDFKTKIRRIFNVDKQIFVDVLAKGLPLASNEILWSAGMALLFKFYATRGEMVMSGYAVASTIGDIFFTLFGGMAVVTTVVLSQKLGADKIDEAKERSYHLYGLGFFMAIVFGALMFISSFIVPNFYNISAEANEVAVTFIRVQSILFWVYMLSAQSYFILRSGGDMRTTFIMDSGYMWIINIPIVALITYFTDASIIVIFISGQATDLIKMFFSYHLVSKGKWLNNLTKKKA
ncbi:MAG: MATE family efflux transporter [Erysipelotrichaceae bacterium]